jgi:N-ethylmaleimide reductase
MKHDLISDFKLNHLLTLKNRIVMAPMTRAKSSDDHVPTDAMAEYYSKRAQAGLIVTEGTIIRPDGLGYKNVPGIFTESQIKHWKKITDKVHHQNGLIFSQIWHVGRVSHPDLLGGQLPLSPSETIMTGRVSRGADLNYGKSRAVSRDEISELVESFATAAKNAMKAGFDGVEIHGANGYLIDQFLHYHTNFRDDDYGGSAENMTKFAVDVVKACGDAIGYERVGLRLSPGGYLNEMVSDERDALVFQFLLKKLNSLKLAYVHTGAYDDSQKFKELNHMTMTDFLRQHYHGNLIACGGYHFESAAAGMNNQSFDLAAFGRAFIANPDLIQRYVNHQEFVRYESGMLNTLV